MNKIDWSPMRSVMNQLAFKLAIGIVIMMLFGIVIGRICVLIKMPQVITNLCTISAIFFGMWIWAKLFLN
ncbi:hypothetical protein J5Y03_12250 [Bacillus sp. RG28]|uniref:Uncharacterized protein n=1 Tax=Gottfriedia endophytica TaxID=2820819 RepID=A0A940SL51_9BACI|nr:hypothetical protein [Gottfriedia endophytica]MBP0725943.1 hypothetical protein [Gottfriedia endophytica]